MNTSGIVRRLSSKATQDPPTPWCRACHERVFEARCVTRGASLEATKGSYLGGIRGLAGQLSRGSIA